LYHGIILKQKEDDVGRLRVSLSKNNVITDFRASRLVLTAFVGAAPDETEGCHNDGDASNNHRTNLRWDTHTENCRDIVRHGNHFWKNKEQCPRQHLLIEPNLVANQLAKNNRICLACSWATSAIRSIFTWDGIKQACPYSFDILADAYYAKIMGLPPLAEVTLPKRHSERTHCKYEHILAHPNLIIRELIKNNKRICLACQKAFSVKHNAKQRGEIIDFRATADAFYDTIMNT
jgi:hypothetical protein